MSDELQLCRRLPASSPARCIETGVNGCNGGRERKINLAFTKSSLVCLLSNGRVKPSQAASYNQEKGQVDKRVRVVVWYSRAQPPVPLGVLKKETV